MRILARVRSFWRNVARRGELERNLSTELQFHLLRRAEDLRRTRALSPEQAMRTARLEFGSVEKYKDEVRQTLGLRLLDDAAADVRIAFRFFAKNKLSTAAAIVTLGLGIGANAGVFSVMNALLVRPMPVERPEELVVLSFQQPGNAAPSEVFTNPLWEAIRGHANLFAGVFAWSSARHPFDVASGGAMQTVDGLVVSGDYFAALGVRAAGGRLIAKADDHPSCAAVAVLSDAFARTQFGAPEHAVGAAMMVNRQPFQVIGVAAPGFSGVEAGRKFDVAVPICASAAFDKRNVESRGRWWLRVMGRLEPGTTRAQLQARLDVLAPGVMSAGTQGGDPARDRRFVQSRLLATPAGGGPSILRRTFLEPLKILMVGVAVVLLIACANIAGLMQARSLARGREMAIRTAIGASRPRLVRQLLVESALLSLLGASLGLLFAKWSAGVAVGSLRTARNPVFLEVPIDGAVLGFTAAVAVLTAILVGVLPALRATGVSLTAVMNSRQTAAVGVRAGAGRWIVGAQFALSLVLLVGAGLLVRSFTGLLTQDAGFDRAHVLVMSAKTPTFAADTLKVPPEARAALHEEVARRLRLMPGVLSVARTFTTPIGSDNYVTSVAADIANPPTGDQASAYFNFVTPGYFETLRMPLVAGRDFSDRDRDTSAPVAVVNETAARLFFPGVHAVGRQFTMFGRPARIEIVGIVRDSKYDSLRQQVPPTVFLHAAHAPASGRAEEFVIRTSIAPAVLVPEIQRAMLDVGAQIPLTMQTLDQQVADTLVRERLLAAVAGFFGILALILTTIGLYAVMSHLVTQRQAEFGVRMALGAGRAAILRLVARDVTLVLVAGVTIGLLGALSSARLLRGLLFGIEPHDPATIAAAIGLLCTVALLAAYLPARRATRVDPVTAVRTE